MTKLKVQFVTLKGITIEMLIYLHISIKINDTIKLNDVNPDFFNQLNTEQDRYIVMSP